MYIFIIILLIISFFILKKQIGSLNENNSKGYSDKMDNVSIIIDRIEWASLHPTRINIHVRYIIWSAILSYLSCMILLNKFPPSYLFIQLFLILWIGLISIDGFFDWHSDKFSIYTIIDNIHKLRKKLNVKKNTFLSNRKEEIKGWEEPWTFVYEMDK
jgi:hypothetical protein